MVDNKIITRNEKSRFVGEAVFDISHLIKDIEADENTYMIFEIQGRPDGEKVSFASLGLD
jgi:hypothetical protein